MSPRWRAPLPVIEENSTPGPGGELYGRLSASGAASVSRGKQTDSSLESSGAAAKGGSMEDAEKEGYLPDEAEMRSTSMRYARIPGSAGMSGQTPASPAPASATLAAAAPPPASTPQAELAGRLLIPHTAIDIDLDEPELGRGGFAVVRQAMYRPHATAQPRAVAVKIFTADVDATALLLKDEIVKFLDVVLHCTHVAKMYGFTQFPEDHPCSGWAIVMHLYPQDLRKYIKSFAPSPPPLTEALRIAVEVAWGLQSVHEELGAAHSDLKPQNILLDRKFGVHISDFGALKALGADRFVAVEAFTLVYCAPEQREEEGGTLTTASDVWALGLIIVELLCGKRPWNPKKAEGPDLGTIPDAVPHDLVLALRRCFDRDPEKRATARDVAEAVEGAIRQVQNAPHMLGSQLPSQMRAWWQTEISPDSDRVPWQHFRKALRRLAARQQRMWTVLDRGNEVVTSTLQRMGMALQKAHRQEPFLDIIVQGRLDPGATGTVEASQLFAVHVELSTWLHMNRAGQSHETMGEITEVEELFQVLIMSWQGDAGTLSSPKEIVQQYMRVKTEGLRKVIDHTAYLRSMDRMRKEAPRMQQGSRQWLFDIVKAWLDIHRGSRSRRDSDSGNGSGPMHSGMASLKSKGRASLRKAGAPAAPDLVPEPTPRGAQSAAGKSSVAGRSSVAGDGTRSSFGSKPLEERTRWLFKEDEDGKTKNVMAVVSPGGFGKTALAAGICLDSRFNVHAFHFCRGVDESTRTARSIVHSFAFQLASSVPAAFDAILDAASAMQQDDVHGAGGGTHAASAFEALIREPLANAVDQGAAVSGALVVVDGVDEMPARERALLLGLDWEALPLCVLFLSRDVAVSTLRGRAVWVDLQLFRAELEQDIESFAKSQLQGLVPEEEMDEAARALSHHSGKSFLYMRMILAQVQQQGGAWSAMDLWSLPANLDDIFEEDLRRVLDGLDLDMQQRVETLLTAMVAAPEPLRIDWAAALIQSLRTGESLRSSDIHAMLYRLNELIEVSDGEDDARVLQFHHMAMKDWLVNRGSAKVGAARVGKSEEKTRLFVMQAHHTMASLCVNAIQSVRFNDLFAANPIYMGPAHDYVIRHTVVHLMVVADCEIEMSTLATGGISNSNKEQLASLWDRFEKMLGLVSKIVNNVAFARAHLEAGSHRYRIYATDVGAIVRKMRTLNTIIMTKMKRLLAGASAAGKATAIGMVAEQDDEWQNEFNNARQGKGQELRQDLVPSSMLGGTMAAPKRMNDSATDVEHAVAKAQAQIENLKEMVFFLGSLNSYAAHPEAASLTFQAIMSAAPGTFPRQIGDQIALDPQLPLHSCLVEFEAPVPAPLVGEVNVHSRPVTGVCVNGIGTIVGSVASNEEDIHGHSSIAVWSTLTGRFRGRLSTGEDVALSSVACDGSGNVFCACGSDGKLFVWEVKKSRGAGSSLNQGSVRESSTSRASGNMGTRTGLTRSSGDTTSGAGTTPGSSSQHSGSDLGERQHTPVNRANQESSSNGYTSLQSGSGESGSTSSGRYSFGSGSQISGALSGPIWGKLTVLPRSGSKQASHRGAVLSAAMSDDGSRIITGGDDHTVRVWDWLTDKDPLILSTHSRGVTTVAISPSGAYAVSGSLDGTCVLWELGTGELPTQVEGVRVHDGQDGGDGVSSVAIRVNETKRRAQVFVAVGIKGVIKVFDGLSGSLLRDFIIPGGDPHWVYIGQTSSVVGCLFRWRSMSRIVVWDLESAIRVCEFRGEKLCRGGVSHNGAIMAAGTLDGDLRMWDLQSALKDVETGSFFSVASKAASGRTLSEEPTSPAAIAICGHSSQINCIAMTADGSKVLSCSEDGNIILWETEITAKGGVVLAEVQPRLEPITSCSITVLEEDVLRVAVAYQQQTVSIWDLTVEGTGTSDAAQALMGKATGKVCSIDDFDLKWSFDPTSGQNKTLSMSSNGTLVVVGGNLGRVRAFNLVDGKKPAPVFDHRHRSSISNVDIRIAESGHVWLAWSAEDGMAGVSILRKKKNVSSQMMSVTPGVMQYLPHPLDVGGLAIVEDHESRKMLVITGCNDRYIRAWDAKTGEMLWRFTATHRGWITNLNISANYEYMATTCNDDGVRVFHLRPRTTWHKGRKQGSAADSEAKRKGRADQNKNTDSSSDGDPLNCPIDFVLLRATQAPVGASPKVVVGAGMMVYPTSMTTLGVFDTIPDVATMRKLQAVHRREMGVRARGTTGSTRKAGSDDNSHQSRSWKRYSRSSKSQGSQSKGNSEGTSNNTTSTPASEGEVSPPPVHSGRNVVSPRGDSRGGRPEAGRRSMASGATGDSDTVASGNLLSKTKPLYSLSGLTLRDLTLAVCPSTRMIATGDTTGQIALWKDDGTLIFRSQVFRRRVLCVYFSQDGRTVMFGSSDESVAIITFRGELLLAKDAYKAENHYTVAKEQVDLMTKTLSDGIGQETHVIKAGMGEVLAVGSSDDAAIIGAASVSGTIKLWSRFRGTIRNPWVEIWSEEAGVPVVDISLCGSGSTLAVLLMDGRIHVYSWRGFGFRMWLRTGWAPAGLSLSSRWQGTKSHSLAMEGCASLYLSRDSRVLVAAGSTFSVHAGELVDDVGSGVSRVWDLDVEAGGRSITLPDDTVCGSMIRVVKADARDYLHGFGSLAPVIHGYFILSIQGSILRLAYLHYVEETGSFQVDQEGTWMFYAGDPKWRSAAVTSAFPLVITAVDSYHNVRRLGLRTTLSHPSSSQRGDIANQMAGGTSREGSLGSTHESSLSGHSAKYSDDMIEEGWSSRELWLLYWLVGLSATAVATALIAAWRFQRALDSHRFGSRAPNPK